MIYASRNQYATETITSLRLMDGCMRGWSIVNSQWSMMDLLVKVTLGYLHLAGSEFGFRKLVRSFHSDPNIKNMLERVFTHDILELETVSPCFQGHRFIGN